MFLVLLEMGQKGVTDRQKDRQKDRPTDKRLGPLIKQSTEYTTPRLLKMYNRLILNRIRSVIDLKLRIYQNGFRSKRTTVAQILTLRRIIAGVKENNLSAIITFIDFKKAFDSIHRGKMMQILRVYGIPPNLLRAIEKWLEG